MKQQLEQKAKLQKKNNIKILGTVFSMYDRKKDKGYSYYGKGYYGKGYYSYYRSYLDEEGEKGVQDTLIPETPVVEDMAEIDVEDPNK